MMNQDPNLEKLKREFEILHSMKRNVFKGVYFTLLSVIGGVAIGLVPGNLKSFFGQEFTHICDISFDQWLVILLSIASLLTIVTVLSGYFLTISYFYWEINLWDVLILMGTGIPLILMAAHINQPETWLLWISSVGMMGGVAFGRTLKKIKAPEPEIEIIKKLINVNKTKSKAEDLIKKESKHLCICKWLCLGSGGLFLFYFILVNYIKPSFGACLSHCDEFLIAIIIIILCLTLLFWRYRKTFKSRKNEFDQIEMDLTINENK